jgi:hypothetical protein
MKFYYLHVTSSHSYVINQTSLDSTGKQIIMPDLMPRLVINEWLPDDLFSESLIFFVTERLRSLLIYNRFKDLKFDKINHIEKGGGFSSKYPDTELPPFYWRLEIGGVAGQDDFGVFDYEMVVSQKALDFLRNNRVTHAEADEITVPLAEYFDSPRKYFWMQDERIRQYFIDMDNRRKKQMPDGQER